MCKRVPDDTKIKAIIKQYLLTCDEGVYLRNNYLCIADIDMWIEMRLACQKWQADRHVGESRRVIVGGKNVLREMSDVQQ